MVSEPSPASVSPPASPASPPTLTATTKVTKCPGPGALSDSKPSCPWARFPPPANLNSPACLVLGGPHTVQWGHGGCEPRHTHVLPSTVSGPCPSSPGAQSTCVPPRGLLNLSLTPSHSTPLCSHILCLRPWLPGLGSLGLGSWPWLHGCRGWVRSRGSVAEWPDSWPWLCG